MPSTAPSATAIRPTKRRSEFQDASNESQPTEQPGPKPKAPRLDRAADDFSSVIKSKLQSNSRTGQACDRCKVRKIRCDALPEGCSHCKSQHLDCNVTDRVSGRTERRGYLQQLERETKDMLRHIRDLEALLQKKGTIVKSYELASAEAGVTKETAIKDERAGREQSGSVWIKEEPSMLENSGTLTPQTVSMETRVTDAHLGVATDSAPWSAVNGTSLSILGTTLDITSFVSTDMDDPRQGTRPNAPLYNKSVQAWINSVTRVNPLQDAPLPSREEAFTYSEWYFIMVAPFIPIVHKPTYMALLARIYDDTSAQPTTPELVNVHMLFAMMYYQFGVRNEQPESKLRLIDLSNKHYHWCLHKVYELMSSQDFAAVQALTFITCFARSFPKPGSVYLMAGLAFKRAVELNLHRKSQIPEALTNLDNEMRKRVWWCILMISATINGRLGRPMPIRMEEYDVEIPILIDDEYLTDEGITDADKIGRATWTVAHAIFKLVPILLEMFGSIYCVKREPQSYMEAVKRLETQHKAWQDALHADLSPENSHSSLRIFSLYCEAISCEVVMCLRHPSACVSNDASFVAQCTRISEAAARKLIKTVYSLLKLKSLDTTWYQLSVYVAAILTILVAAWQRRAQASKETLEQLRLDMSMGLAIVAEIGQSIGSGSNLSIEIGVIVNRTIAWIERDCHGVSSAPRTPVEAAQVTQTSGNKGQTWAAATPTAAWSVSGSAQPLNGASSAGVDHNPQAMPSHTQDHMIEHLQGMVMRPQDRAVSEARMAGRMPPSAVGDMSSMHTHPNMPQNIHPHNQVAFTSEPTHPPPVPLHDMAAQIQQSWHTPTPVAMEQNTWHDWAAAIIDPSGQERLSANALLTMGNSSLQQPHDPDALMMTSAPVLGVNGMSTGLQGQSASAAAKWPLLLFDDTSLQTR